VGSFGVKFGYRGSRVALRQLTARVEVMERFYDYYGEQPSHKALGDFATREQNPDERRRQPKMVGDGRGSGDKAALTGDSASPV
jgi:hypothetical protein